jgi:hypothetical protein
LKNLTLSGLLLIVALQASAQAFSNGKGALRVMTYNANEGTDFFEIQAATDQQSFLAAVVQTIVQVRATNPPARMQALAKQIIAASPDLVGVQELDQWSTGPLDLLSGCGAMTTEFDMLQELQDALAAQGAHYRVAVRQQQYAFPATPGAMFPSGPFLCVALVGEIAILARTDLDPSKFQVGNPQSAQYVSTLVFPTPIGTLPCHGPGPRWMLVSTDKPFASSLVTWSQWIQRCSGLPSIRRAQGAELRGGPANTTLPVVIAMDSNFQAAPLPQDPSYVDFVLAGYNNVWLELQPGVPGLTCCQAELDNNPVSQLYQRIDLILTMGPVEAQNVALFGATAASRTSGGLWPSDHAGVAAQ